MKAYRPCSEWRKDR